MAVLRAGGHEDEFGSQKRRQIRLPSLVKFQLCFIRSAAATIEGLVVSNKTSYLGEVRIAQVLIEFFRRAMMVQLHCSNVRLISQMMEKRFHCCLGHARITVAASVEGTAPICWPVD
jgi:hypothetical protein